MVDEQLRVTPVESTDLPFLWDMLWEAAAVDDGLRAAGREYALAQPSTRRYLDGWGRPGDLGLVARDRWGQRLGAAWVRLFPPDAPAYGTIGPDIPELTIGVSTAARGRGAGGALLDGILAEARALGYRAVSLSVDRRNPAVRLYERKGFRDAGVSSAEETSVTMVVDLISTPD